MSETALRIRLIGDPVLRKKSKQVSRITAHHRDILSQMSQMMYDSAGIGLAAPQIGISESMIVVDIGTGLYKLINPGIVKREGAKSREEGCLSVPGVCIKVKRANKVVVHAQDDDGKPVEIKAEDLLACVLQHEIDHLKGKLIVDHASFIDKIRIKKRVAAIKKQARSQESN
ncbi:peptide deformylase, partial [bacterium]